MILIKIIQIYLNKYRYIYINMIKLSLIFFLLFITSIQGFYYHLFNINTVIRKSLDDSLINFIKINNVNYLRVKNTHPKYLILKYFHDKPIEKDDGNMENGKLFVNLPSQIMIRDETEHIMNYISSISHHHDNKEDKEENENNEEMKKYDEEEYENKNYDIYELIRKNEKQILILYERNNKELNFKHLYLIKDKYNYIYKYGFNYKDNKYKYLFDIKASEITKYETHWNITTRFRYNPTDITEVYKNNILNWIKFNIYNNVNNYNNYYYKRYLLYKDLNSGESNE